MTVKQLSVFIENRQGRLGEVLHVLKENNVNILSLSVADTAEYGLLRLIVDDAVHGRDVLLDAGFSSMLTDVIILKVEHTPGSLQSTLTLIADGGINIEYMYGLSIEGSDASIVMKTNQLDQAKKLFREKNVKTASEEEISGITK